MSKMPRQKRRPYHYGKGKRKKGVKWDYNGDGRYVHERIKGKDKRHWKRWTRRTGKKYSEKEKQEVLTRFALKMNDYVDLDPELVRAINADEYWEL